MCMYGSGSGSMHVCVAGRGSVRGQGEVIDGLVERGYDSVSTVFDS